MSLTSLWMFSASDFPQFLSRAADYADWEPDVQSKERSTDVALSWYLISGSFCIDLVSSLIIVGILYRVCPTSTRLTALLRCTLRLVARPTDSLSSGDREQAEGVVARAHRLAEVNWWKARKSPHVFMTIHAGDAMRALPALQATRSPSTAMNLESRHYSCRANLVRVPVKTFLIRSCPFDAY